MTQVWRVLATREHKPIRQMRKNLFVKGTLYADCGNRADPALEAAATDRGYAVATTRTTRHRD